MRALLGFIALIIMLGIGQCKGKPETNGESLKKTTLEKPNAIGIDTLLVDLERINPKLYCELIQYHPKLKEYGNTQISFFRTDESGKKDYLLVDTIWTITIQKYNIQLADYNNDGTKDFLIYSNSDMRNNVMCELYLSSLNSDGFLKIKGMQWVKNPTYIPSKDIWVNYVLSGKNYTEFYRVEEDTIKNFGETIYDEQNSPTEWQGTQYLKKYHNFMRKLPGESDTPIAPPPIWFR